MGGSTVYLPDGQTITVTPVFAGLFFKSNELTTHRSPFPAGWTTVLQTQESGESESASTNPPDGDKAPLAPDAAPAAAAAPAPAAPAPGQSPGQGLAASPVLHTHSFRRPTLQQDSLFISSISNPSSSDFKPAASPTRQIAMMLWVTLYWYFHQPEPDALLPATAASQSTPTGGRPRGEWRIHIRRDGILRGRNLLPKLERMGLIATLDTAVGESDSADVGWDNMYVSESMFWQMSAQLFLFTLQPTVGSHGGSPTGSRPASPVQEKTRTNGLHLGSDVGSPGTPATSVSPATSASPASPAGPFYSSSHLPTYFPPGPLRYTTTNGVRHPARPKPPRMGEVFYTRYVPSAGQYLSLRVASSSPRPVAYQGPVGPQPAVPEQTALTALSDTALLQRWLSKPRVSAFWGQFSPDFLPSALASKHSFPVIALWDGVPFGYFEIYWVKEDILGRSVGGTVAATDFDRGLHVFIGEEWARGRVQQWLSSVVHWILTSDYRTMSICIEPRVDNVRFIQLLQLCGFNKQCEVTFPHKQSWFGRLHRDGWTGPALLANVLVTNAASAQSGSVIRALLAPDDGRPESVRVLAVTRDATLPAAQELVARYPSDRLELIQSDTRDPAALLAGRPHGSIAAACLFTWPPAEEQQAIPLIDALVAHGVGHVVFWSVDRGGQHQSWDNPTDIESFAEKHRIERHLRDRGGEPDAAFTWTILRPVCFMDNLDMHSFCGIFVSMWSLSLSPHRRLQLIARRDVGVWAAKAIGASLARSPEARRASPYANRAVSLAGDERTLTEVRAIFRRVVGSEPPWSWSILGRMTMWTLPVLSKVFAMYEREGGGVDVAALRAEEPWMLDLETYLRDYSGWKKAGGPTKEKTI